ncbi:MAG TPA: hemolysin family protein [Phnomibacter sp.]|nr:hemolysin family protein [Phnomibacter sp.]
MYLALLILALLLTGFFAGIEVAFVSTNKLGIELKKKQGRRSGFIVSSFFDNSTRFVGACLVGFNIFLVAYGLLVTQFLSPFWKWVGLQRLDDTYALRLLLNVIVSTLLVMVIEFMFKAIFRAKNDALLSFFARTTQAWYTLMGPVASMFVKASNWMLQYIFNIKVADPHKPFGRIDIEHYFQQTKEVEEDGSSELNQELFENALSLPGVKVRSCLVPRKEIVAVELSTPIADVVQKMIDTKLSKLVVYDADIDNIVGYVHQLDMFRQATHLNQILLPIPAVPETMAVIDLINKFSKERKSIAWVVDEFGGTAGIVTMEDLLEEIFGEIHDEYDTEEFVEQQLADNTYLLSGRLELDYLAEKYDLSFEKGESETLSGYIIRHHERMPRQGERVIVDNYQFEVLNASDTRLELVKLKVLH